MWGGREKHPNYINRWRLPSLKKLWYVSHFCINISKLIPKYWQFNNFLVHTMYIFTPAQPFRSLCFGWRIIEGSVSPKCYYPNPFPLSLDIHIQEEETLCVAENLTVLSLLWVLPGEWEHNKVLQGNLTLELQLDPQTVAWRRCCQQCYPLGDEHPFLKGILLLAVEKINCTNKSMWACSWKG